MSYGLRITDAGSAAIEAAIQNGQVIQITKFGIGNGLWADGDEPQSLKNQLHEFPLDELASSADPNVPVLTGSIPFDIGGFTLTEISVKTDDGVDFAVMPYPRTYLPNPEEAQVPVDRPVEFHLNIGAPDVVDVPFNPQVTATQAWVTAQIQSIDHLLAENSEKLEGKTLSEVVALVGYNDQPIIGGLGEVADLISASKDQIDNI